MQYTVLIIIWLFLLFSVPDSLKVFVLAAPVVFMFMINLLGGRSAAPRNESKVIDRTSSVGKSSKTQSHMTTTSSTSSARLNDSIFTKVVGVTFEGRQSVVAELRVGEYLELISEPDNPHDSNAIKVVRENGQQVGYIDRDLALKIKWCFQASNFAQYAEVLQITGDKQTGQSLGVNIRIDPPTESEIRATVDHLYPY
jgi:hypothetical protein